MTPDITPNAFAWVVFACWPVLILSVYAYRRRSGEVALTTAWMMLLSVMFLPSALVFKVPGLPFLNKHRLMFLSIAVALQLFHRRDLLRKAPGHNFPRLVMIGLILGIVQTVRTNGDVFTFGSKVLRPLTSHDIPSDSIALLLDLYLPFAIGQRVFQTERDLRQLFKVLTVCALIYAPFMLVELRMSPQFHYWVYGYHPSIFLQAMRYGGYRPMVFMNHGLSVAMFSFTTLCAALALSKVGVKLKAPATSVRATISGGLVLICKSMGAIVYSLAALPLLFFFSRRVLQVLILVLAVVVVIYPVTRATGAFPVDDIIQFFERINPERAFSLDYRFKQEDRLLTRAAERPLYGWGTFGRNRVYTPWGQDISVTDGYWIIVLGSYGYVGFAGFFLIMLIPPLRFVWNCRRMPRSSQIIVGALTLMVMVFSIDFLPNAPSDRLPIVYAGALFTLSRVLVRGKRRQSESASAVESPGGWWEGPAQSVPPVPETGGSSSRS